MKKMLILFLLFFAFTLNADASTIPEGAIVKTADNPDVYIVKYNNGKQYKRLVLNLQVFKSYGHLKWENLLTIPQSEMDSFTISDLVRIDGTSDVYQLMPNGDVGNKYLISSTYGFDTDGIYIINETDFNNYTAKGTVDDSANSKIAIYYSDTCPHCMNLKNYLAENGVRKKLIFAAKNVSSDSENAVDMMNKAALCGMSSDKLGVPFLWDGENGNKCLVGDNDVINYFRLLM